MDKRSVRIAAFNFLAEFGSKIKTKFSNISTKTGRYDVPIELFQKRCKRSNRVLISWKTVQKNNLTYEQLKTFAGGVVVEFVNNDFFAEENQDNQLFIKLKEKLGGDGIVSSIISIRSEFGNPSTIEQRKSFEKLKDNLSVMYKGQQVLLNEANYKDFLIKRLGGFGRTTVGSGNEKWTGFIYISIRGGQQDTITFNNNPQIFNPACEYATDDVCEDINLVMSYFAFMSIDVSSLNLQRKDRYTEILNDIRKILSTTEYDSGNLLEYCENHPCLKMCPRKLYDPIQIEEIDIMDFSIDNKEDERNLDFTHDEAVNKEKFYWDSHKKCILSPARPTNVFWSRHLSNMMQQSFTLEEYFRHQEEIVNRRKSLLRQNVTV